MKIKVIGAGGIGSYFAHHIDHLIELEQIPSDWDFTFYDDDVVEMKNMLYQNFETSDIDSEKTTALSTKYFNINFETRRLDSKDLAGADLIILCADNNKIRREVFNSGIPFIDSRANGRAVGIFSSETENYLDTIDKDNKPSSCQNPFQIAKKEIEYGNVVIAAILAQCILTYVRKNTLPSNLMLSL